VEAAFRLTVCADAKPAPGRRRMLAAKTTVFTIDFSV
jgi:hypothetical protein